MAAAGMRFCRECNNMLYPKENKVTKVLEFACRNCFHSEEVEERCIYVNEIVKDTRTQLEIIPEDITDDPTLQRNPQVPCPECGNEGAAFIRSHDGGKDSTLSLIWVCLHYECRYRWIE